MMKCLAVFCLCVAGFAFSTAGGYAQNITVTPSSHKAGKASLGTIDFSNTTRCDNETDYMQADVSKYIQWKKDEYNEFR